MALSSKFKNDNSLHRKFLTPVVKKVSYNQLLNDGDRLLFRSVSCGELWKPSPDGKVLKTTQVTFSKHILPRRRNLSAIFDNDCVDSGMAGHRKRNDRGIDKSTSSKPKIGLFTMLYWLTTLVLAVAAYFYMYTQRTWEFGAIKMHLQRHLYGQNAAVESLESAVNFALQAERSKLVVFTGGVGVGKTLTASIIFETFPWPGQAKKTSAPQLAEENLFSVMSIFGWNLLIIDDCPVDIDESHVQMLDALLNHTRQKDIKLFIILVCTVRRFEEITILKKSLVSLEPYMDVSFADLGRDIVKKCFNRDILKMQLVIPDEELERLIDLQLQPVAEVGGPPGCKQVDMKLIEYIDIENENE